MKHCATTRRRKWLVGLTVGAAVLFIAAYLIGNVALTIATRRLLESLIVPARQSGVELATSDFEKARIAGIRSVRWEGLSATVRLSKSTGFDDAEQFALSIDSAVIQLVGDGMARLEAQGVTAVKLDERDDESAATNATNERIVADRLIAHLPFELRNPGKALRTFVPNLITLLVEGVAPMRLMTHGTLEFTLHDGMHELPFSIVTIEHQSWFLLEPDAVKRLAAEFSEELTDAEVQVVAEQPLKAPALLQIKIDAERTSQSAARSNPNVPEDAYRHVLWSYLLAKRFGPEFAETVTDAHEIGAVDNTAAQQRMDYRNNAIGRSYAAEGLARNQVLAQLLDDARVVRSPE